MLIDLSLSTDDEGTSQNGPRHLKLDAPAAFASGNATYLLEGAKFLDDGYDCADTLSKRRRLSSPSATEIQQAKESAKSIHRGSPSSKRAPLAVKITNRDEVHKLSDDILFASSADLKNVVKIAQVPPPKEGTSESADESLPEDFFTMEASNIAPSVSNRTASLLAKLKKLPASKEYSVPKPTFAAKGLPKRTSWSSKLQQERLPENPSSEDDDRAHRKALKKPRLTEEEKAAKRNEKEKVKAEVAAQKARDKDKEKGRKLAEREGKARDKQRVADLTEVNKVKKDKKETSKEMIVDLPMSIEGQRVNDQIREFLKNLGVESNTYQSPVLDVIRWRRKVDSLFDEGKGYRVAVPKAVQDESHILCLLSARDFIKLVIADSTRGDIRTLDEHIQNLEANYDRCTPIYLIEGFHTWMRKNRNLRNREYQAAVLDQANANDVEVSCGYHRPSRRRKVAEAYVDEDLIEDALLRLQIMNNCLIHHTATAFESAEWVANFTQHISQVPYRRVRLAYYVASTLIQE